MKSLEDAPVLQRHLHWIWKAFTDMNFRRGVSMGGALPFTYSDIHAYCSLRGIYSLLERERLIRFLDSLDRHWLAHHYKKQSQNSPENPPQPKPRTRPRVAKPAPRTRVS